MLIFLLISYSQNIFSYPENINFEHISIKQGLSQSSVSGITQDKIGFLWFGTEDGINRYDGYSFVHYKHDSKNSNSIISNYVYNVFTDNDGDLWVSTRGGIHRYLYDKDHFKRYIPDPKNPSSISAKITYNFCHDKSGFIWLATTDGLNKLDKKTDSFTIYKHNENDSNSLSNDHVYDVKADKNGKIWIATANGLNQYDPKTDRFRRFFHEPDNENSVLGNLIKIIYIDSQNNLWISSSDKGISSVNLDTLQFNHNKPDPKNPDSIIKSDRVVFLEDKNGYIWIAVEYGGLHIHDPKTEKRYHYRADPLNPYSLTNNIIDSLYEDRSGVIWLGTNAGGINKYSKYKEKFYKLTLSYINHDDMTWSIYEDHNKILWIGTRKGLIKWNRKTKEYKLYQHDVNNSRTITPYSVWVILQDMTDNNILWVATSKGLNKFNIKKETFQRYFYSADQKRESKNIRSLFQEDKSTLWVGSQFSGLIKFDIITNKFVAYSYQQDNDKSISDNYARRIFQDKDKQLWIGTNNGLNLLNKETGEFSRFLSGNNSFLKTDRIICIQEDEQGLIWFGTGAGLYRYDKSIRQAKIYTVDNGLPNNVIYGILIDHHQRLWLSTNYGLSCFDPKTEQFKNFDVNDGLQSNEFNVNAYYRNPLTKELYFGGISGVNIFNPDKIRFNEQKPQIIINQFKKYNKEVKLDKPIWKTNELTISYNDNYFSFEFSALDFNVPEKNRYQYKFESFDKAWINAGSRRYASYTNLEGGQYTFKVKASNNDGIWNEKGYSLNITVIPPPWKTWWAYSLYVLSVFGLFSLFIGFRTRAHKKMILAQAKELEQEQKVTDQLIQLDRLKDDFLVNTSHELQTPLNGMIGIANSMVTDKKQMLNDNDKENLSLILSSGNRLSNLVKNILDFSRLKYKDINLILKTVDIYTTTDIVFRSLKYMVMNKDVKLINRISQDVPFIQADEEKVYQIMYNLIGNAIKFTTAGKIMVSGKAADDFFEVTVSDTGIGIPGDSLSSIFDSFEKTDRFISKEQKGSGLGLTITKTLVELHGGSIRVESEPGNGSTFIFTLPLSKEKIDKKLIKTEQALDSQIIATEYSTKKNVKKEIENSDIKILIVDDDPINLRVLSNYLTLENYFITQAHDGSKALELIIEDPDFDLIVLDVMMPGISGYEVCRTIRLDHPSNFLPVILLTVKDQMADLIDAFEAGANDYITKPFSKDELLSRVQLHLNLSKATKEQIRLTGKVHDSLKNKIDTIRALVAGQLSDMSESDKLNIVHKLASHCSNESRNILFVLKNKECNIEKLVEELVLRAKLSAAPLDIEYTFTKNEFAEGIIIKPSILNSILDIYNEILNNIVKHSEAATFDVNFNYTNELIMLSVKDDGVGFDYFVQSKKENSYGLELMEQLSAQVGGKLNILSKKANGTEVQYIIKNRR